LHCVEYWRNGIWHRDLYEEKQITKLGHIDPPHNSSPKEFRKWLKNLYVKYGYELKGII